MEHSQILEKIRNIKANSAAYQSACKAGIWKTTDEIGGHVGYDQSDSQKSPCPSDEFLTSLFQECAVMLGFSYEQQ